MNCDRLYVLVWTLLILSTAADASPILQRQLNWNLLDSVSDGDTSRVRSLLARGANPNSHGRDGSTPLIAASYTGQMESGYHPIEIVRLLLAHGARADYRDSHGVTPLMVAASTSSMTAMHLLLDTGARVDSGDYEGRTPLMHAACAEGEAAYSNPVAVAFLITRGANVNAQDRKGRTPLMMAATVEDDAAGTLGSLRTARLLLAAKARTDLRDRNGDTALTLAVRHHNQGIVALLRNLAQKKPTRNSPKVIRKPVRR